MTQFQFKDKAGIAVFETEAETFRAALEQALQEGADLRAVDFSGYMIDGIPADSQLQRMFVCIGCERAFDDAKNGGCPYCEGKVIFAIQNWLVENRFGSYQRCLECRKFFDGTDGRRRLCLSPECKREHNKKTARDRRQRARQKAEEAKKAAAIDLVDEATEEEKQTQEVLK